jgi:hypothetical protein
LHEPTAEQFTGTLAVVPDTLTCPTDGLPDPVLVELLAVIDPDCPLLPWCVLSPP